MKYPKVHIDPGQLVSTDITMGLNEPTRVLSKLHGDDINGIVFNLKYLDEHNPTAAERLRQLADELSKLSSNEPPAHEEDVLMIGNRFQKIATESRGYPDKQ